MRESRTVHERMADDELVLSALNAGARNALLEHQRAGNAVCEWKDGMIVWVPPSEIFSPTFLPSVEAVSDFICVTCGQEFQVHRTANGNGAGPYSVACPSCGRQHEIPSSPVRTVALPGPKKYRLD